MAQGILSVWNDRDEEIARAYESWYVGEHVPERLGVAGFLSARRYEAVRGAPRFMTYYELESPQVLSSPDYLARLASPTEQTRSIMAHFRNMMRTACVLAYHSSPGVIGAYAAAAWVESPAAVDADRLLRAALSLKGEPRALCVQLWRAAPDPAHAANREARLRPGGDRRIEAALVVDGMREADALQLEESAAAAIRHSVAAGAVARSGVYRLLGSWRAPRA